jgi:hypothetical protein
MDQNATGMGEQEVHGPMEMDSEPVNASEFASPQVGYGLMDVLFPASPPVARNARIVRLFDLEAAKYDPSPATPQEGATAAVALTTVTSAPAPKEPRARNVLREERRASLAAAAGLF